MALTLLPVALGLLGVVLGGCAGDREPVAPEIVRVTPEQALVTWSSATPYSGFVLYRSGAAAGEQDWLRAEEGPGASRLHEVALQGLRPGELVSYRVMGQEPGFELRTPPRRPVPWSFLVVAPSTGPELSGLLSDPVEVLLVAGALPRGAEPDPVAAARPYLPVYDFGGRHSPHLMATEGPGRGPQGPWHLDWGGLRLLFVRTPDEIPAAAVGVGLHTVALVVVPGGAGTGSAARPAPRSGQDWQRAITRHNNERPRQPIAFVLLPASAGMPPARTDPASESTGTLVARWLQLPSAEARWALRVDVAPERIRATWRLGGEGSVQLRSPPLGVKRTCAECRRLAERGDYLAAVEAYRQFLRTNDPQHFQVDDAHYAIAELLDQRLFRPEQALAWYGRLLLRYPRSSLAPLASERVTYLKAHSDCGFGPLSAFERLRRQGWAKARGDPQAERRVLAEATGVLEGLKRPCALRPEILLWSANQRSLRAPDEAVATYRLLRAEHPDHSHASQASVQIGETWYAAGRFADAVQAFERAAQLMPERSTELRARATRAGRNLRRRQLAAAAAAAMVALVLSLLLRPGGAGPPVRVAAGGRRRAPGRLPSSAVALRATLLGAALAAVLAVVAGALRDQFWSSAEGYGLALGLAALTWLGALLGAALGARARARWGGGAPAQALLGSAVGWLWLAAGAYLLVFLLNEHYLVVVGL